MNKFELGQVVQTSGVAAECEDNKEFAQEIKQCFEKYINCDWGDTCKNDAKLNDEAVKTNNDRIVAKYITSKGEIFIITEWDRSSTTIMFTYEY